jgi:MFS family permease
METSVQGNELGPRLGILPNLGQFLVQTLLVFFVGITIGLERNVVPVLAREEFGIASTSVILSFVVSFGFVKALLNLLGGILSESWGRKPVLVLGWLVAVPIPLIIIWAPNWWWIVFANVLMGVNQGLAWSMTVTAKMDIVGAKWRGLATGINEFAGYSGVASGALVTGYLAAAYGLRPVPFYFGLAVILAALGIAAALSRETLPHAQAEARQHDGGTSPSSTYRAARRPGAKLPSFLTIFKLTTWEDRAMFAASQAGLLHKFTDALVWVSFPLFFKAQGLEVQEIGLIIGAYGFTWGFLQLGTGVLTDRVGRRWPIVGGLILCGAGVWLTIAVSGMALWTATAAVIGAGMALLYPSLLATIGDVAHPRWRSTSLGVYRMWRDSGYAFGALLIGLISDTLGFTYGFYFTALAMFISGIIVALTMYETAPARRSKVPRWQRNSSFLSS